MMHGTKSTVKKHLKLPWSYLIALDPIPIVHLVGYCYNTQFCDELALPVGLPMGISFSPPDEPGFDDDSCILNMSRY